MWTQHNKNKPLSPQDAIQLLRDGNQRFLNNLRINRNLLQQVNETKHGQYPFAAILSCIDSRTSAELIFDQGLGDVFSIRIAGNILNDDILGSMEFATKISGSKVIVVLGHTRCGAIKGACENVQLGYLSGLLKKIQPAIEKQKAETQYKLSSKEEFVEGVAHWNVELTIQEILQKSEIIRTLVESGELALIGGMYNVDTGEVTFYDSLPNSELRKKSMAG